MSEKWIQPDEDMPRMRIAMGEDREFDATPENTTLFTYLGHLACYSHIYFQTGEEDENTLIGTYVFSVHPSYEPMAEFMAGNAYPMVINRREVPDCDAKAFDRMLEQQTTDLDHIPDEWSSDGAA